MKKKELRRNRTKIAFMEATKQIIEDEGIDCVSARKIGDIALYSSTTIYNYFNNLNHLIVLASVEFIKDYLNDLQTVSISEPPLSQYVYIWDSFLTHALKRADIYYRFFYINEISLDEVFQEYFEVLPEMEKHFPKIVDSFIFAGDIYNRNFNCIKSLFQNLDDHSINLISSIHVSLCQSLLINFRENKSEDTEKEKEHFLECIRFTMNLVTK